MQCEHRLLLRMAADRPVSEDGDNLHLTDQRLERGALKAKQKENENNNNGG